MQVSSYDFIFTQPVRTICYIKSDEIQITRVYYGTGNGTGSEICWIDAIFFVFRNFSIMRFESITTRIPVAISYIYLAYGNIDGIIVQ